MTIEPVILNGRGVRLEPLRAEHLEPLCAIGFDGSIWRWTANIVSTRDEMAAYIADALDRQNRGVSLPFVTVENASGQIVGSTRFGNIDSGNRKVEIGWTWINPAWQRTAVNTEAKLLMLQHAFEIWECIRVELKTDVLNEKSRNAILRIGAKQEGILRNHMIIDSGRFRDTVFFSIIESEWPDVKGRLLEKIRSYE
jgi:N-acetyltransferase